MTDVVSECQFLAYSIAIMVVTLLVWFDIFNNSDVLRVGNRTELISESVCLFFQDGPQAYEPES
jgi:hypothetical protein